jgi:hypothetical protein
VAVLAGLVLDVLLVLAAGSGLGANYFAGTIGLYLTYGSVGLIAIGAGVAGIAQRGAGIVLMFVSALFEVGFLIGYQLTLWLVIIPSAT